MLLKENTVWVFVYNIFIPVESDLINDFIMTYRY